MKESLGKLIEFLGAATLLLVLWSIVARAFELFQGSRRKKRDVESAVSKIRLLEIGSSNQGRYISDAWEKLHEIEDRVSALEARTEGK